MNCRSARQVMDRMDQGVDPGLRDHLAACDACRRLAAGLEAARQGLRARHAGITPAPGFATAVRARLRQQPVQTLGLAALRVLPVTVLILMVLTWLAFTAVPAGDSESAMAPTEDVLAWVLEGGEDLQ